MEAIVLPMTHKERFDSLGIRPPKGVLLYGPPGTGKTLMARACAAQTNATYLKLAGPQLVQVIFCYEHFVSMTFREFWFSLEFVSSAYGLRTLAGISRWKIQVVYLLLWGSFIDNKTFRSASDLHRCSLEMVQNL